jgi:hypothetical protein
VNYFATPHEHGVDVIARAVLMKFDTLGFGVPPHINDAVYRALCEVSSILVSKLPCRAFHQKDNRFLLYGIGSMQVEGEKTRKMRMGRPQGHLVDLIVVDIPDGEDVLGLDL